MAVMRKRSKPITLAIDVMSGDHGLAPVLPAVRHALQQYPQLRVQLVGHMTEISDALDASRKMPRKHIRLVHAGDVVGMSESPAAALRNKRHSSMRIALNQVTYGEADACVSAGNTGALMAMSRKSIGMLSGVDRPAIVSPVPAHQGKKWEHTWMLDLGANIDCTADHLFQFACMGSALAAAVDQKPQPRVALLNIGAEEVKGVREVRDCAARLQKSNLNYVGYIEGNDVFTGKADVVVCDGFAGNVALKTVEGVIRMVGQLVHEEFRSNALHQMIGFLAWPVLFGFRRRIDPRRFNGATLLGLKKVVVKSHGAADSLAWYHAIRVALEEAERDVPGRIRQQLDENLGQGATKQAAQSDKQDQTTNTEAARSQAA